MENEQCDWPNPAFEVEVYNMIGHVDVCALSRDLQNQMWEIRISSEYFLKFGPFVQKAQRVEESFQPCGRSCKAPTIVIYESSSASKSFSGIALRIKLKYLCLYVSHTEQL